MCAGVRPSSMKPVKFRTTNRQPYPMSARPATTTIQVPIAGRGSPMDPPSFESIESHHHDVVVRSESDHVIVWHAGARVSRLNESALILPGTRYAPDESHW